MGCCGSSKKKTESKVQLSSLDQLKIRLAKGEIDIEEFLLIKKELVFS